MLTWAAIDEMDPGRRASSGPAPVRRNYGLYSGADLPASLARPAIAPTAAAHAQELVGVVGTPARAALSQLGGTIRPGNNTPPLLGYTECVSGNAAALCLDARVADFDSRRARNM